MLAAFWAVLIDLFQFVFPVKEHPALPITEKEVPKANTGLLLSLRSGQGVSLESGVLAYVCARESILYTRPIVAFDSTIRTLKFSDTVAVHGTEGKFTRVAVDSQVGWVKTEHLTTDRTEIYATLHPNRVYEYDDSETVKIRLWLDDECLGGALYLPLQPIEYILYLMKERGVGIKWPEERPRTPGTLQTILRGKRGVRIGIEPKTFSVMEYITKEKSGVIGLVEAVHPNETIVIKSVGKQVEGEHLIETISKEEWRELRPVFISFV